MSQWCSNPVSRNSILIHIHSYETFLNASPKSIEENSLTFLTLWFFQAVECRSLMLDLETNSGKYNYFAGRIPEETFNMFLFLLVVVSR